MARLTREQEEVLRKFHKWLSMGYARGTADVYRAYVEKFLEFYGEVPPVLEPSEEVEVVMEFLESLPYRDSSRRTACYALRAFYNFLGRPDIASRIPAVRAMPRTPEPITFHFEQLKRVILMVPELRDRALLCVAYCAGLRRSEVCLLNRHDFNPRTCTLIVHRVKGPRGQMVDHAVVLEKWCCEILKQYLRSRRDSHEALFVTRNAGVYRRISREAVRQIFKKLAKMLGREDLRFHQLRHTRATELAHHTQDPILIQKFLGHRNPASTQVYIHLDQSRLARAALQTDTILGAIRQLVQQLEERMEKSEEKG